jgi:hypothetical protein
MSFAMSPELPALRSCEDLCECVLPDSDEMAESIDEVRGGPRATSGRYDGALEAIVGRELVGEPPGGFEFRMGSETLREVAFVSADERLYLN